MSRESSNKIREDFWKNAYRNALGPNTHVEQHMAEMERIAEERIKKTKKANKKLLVEK